MKLHSEISVARLVLYISILFSISDNNSEEQDSLKVRETTILQIDSTDQLPMTNPLPRYKCARKNHNTDESLHNKKQGVHLWKEVILNWRMK